jgi:hypothetical protein
MELGECGESAEPLKQQGQAVDKLEASQVGLAGFLLMRPWWNL